MPIYYKKVNRNSSDAVRFIDKKNRFTLLKSRLSGDDGIDETELSGVEPQSNQPLISYGNFERTLESCEQLVETSYGSVLIAKQGTINATKMPTIVTYHDIGLNYALNFEGFFDLPDNRLLVQSFPVIHINAPGQEKHASRLSDDFAFPTIDQLAVQVKEILDHFEVKSCIGFGAGAGANVLTRVALSYPEFVEGLFLVHPSVCSPSWTEWYYHKKNMRSIETSNGSSLLPVAVQEYLIWHHFGDDPTGKERDGASQDIIELYRSFYRGIALNPDNLCRFISSYAKRSDLKMARGKPERQLKCQSVIVCGSLSPWAEDTVQTNAKLDPQKATWLKLDGCGNVLEEKPEKVSQAFRLFLQGLGYTLKAYERKRALMSGASMPCISSASEDVDLGRGRKNTLIT
ncbi:Protein NDRG3 [Halotydeus destructor]|nr:Protein NDRG3 [Halotydeus destructor]